MRIRSIFALAGAAFISGSALAQSPTPVVVQAVQAPLPANVPSGAPVRAVEANPAAAAAFKTLQEMKAANEELLRKQAATLQKLDELEKAAEQIKIFSKRG